MDRENRVRISIQKSHLQGRSTKTEIVRAKKRLLGVFSSENCVRIGIHKRHLETWNTKTERIRPKKRLSRVSRENLARITIEKSHLERRNTKTERVHYKSTTAFKNPQNVRTRFMQTFASFSSKAHYW